MFQPHNMREISIGAAARFPFEVPGLYEYGILRKAKSVQKILRRQDETMAWSEVSISSVVRALV